MLPGQLRTLAGVGREITVEVEGAVSQRTILDAVEDSYPMLLGTIRDSTTKRRRPMIRFFACEEDHSDDDPDAVLPEEVAAGKEPFLVVTAIAGGSARLVD